MSNENEGNLRRSDWLVGAITQADAREAVERWHYAQGCPNTSVYRHALYMVGEEDKVYGVAMWLPPTPTAARSVGGTPRTVLSLTRLVIAPGVPTNGASFLLGRSMKLIDRELYPILLTYADTGHGHTGAIYKATNWECLGEVPAGDTWINEAGEQRGRKRGGKNLSALEMQELGFVRRPAMPKIKYVHKSKKARKP
jgi:hypothetical protein